MISFRRHQHCSLLFPCSLLFLIALLAVAPAARALTTDNDQQLAINRPLDVDNPLIVGTSTSRESFGAFNLKCFICKRAVAKYQARFESKTTEAEAAVAQLCKELKLQKYDVCDGIINEFGSEVITVLAHRLLDPHHLCSDILRYCPHDSGRTPVEIPCNNTHTWAANNGLVSGTETRLQLFAGWGLESVQGGAVGEESRLSEVKAGGGEGQAGLLKRGGVSADQEENPVHLAEVAIGSGSLQTERSGGKVAKQREKSLGHFLQLTDIHLDLEYAEGSEVSCGRPLCCRTEDGPAKSNASAAGPLGDYKCDASPALFESLASFVESSTELPKLDFAVFTGDVPPHDVWEESHIKTLAAMETVYSRLAVALKGAPLYPVLGNHAGVPVDSFPDPPATAWLMDASWQLWKRWLPADAKATVRKGGYYTLLHEPGLRIVGLNTQYCDPFNFWLLAHSSEPDPAGQLEWLLHVLSDAEAAGEHVVILGHIPIGGDACYVTYSQRYSLILDRFRNTVSAQIFGHTHSDSFKLYYDKATLTEPIAVGFVSPSVTPYVGRNPSFRIFDYQHPANGTEDSLLVDYKQYMLDLDYANQIHNGSHWALEYGARSAYNLTSMSPKSWHALLQRLESEPGLLGDYLHRRAVGRPWACEEECEKSLLCEVKSQTFALYQKCVGGQITSFSTALKVLLNLLFRC